MTAGLRVTSEGSGKKLLAPSRFKSFARWHMDCMATPSPETPRARPSSDRVTSTARQEVLSKYLPGSVVKLASDASSLASRSLMFRGVWRGDPADGGLARGLLFSRRDVFLSPRGDSAPGHRRSDGTASIGDLFNPGRTGKG